MKKIISLFFVLLTSAMSYGSFLKHLGHDLVEGVQTTVSKVKDTRCYCFDASRGQTYFNICKNGIDGAAQDENNCKAKCLSYYQTKYYCWGVKGFINGKCQKNWKKKINIWDTALTC